MACERRLADKVGQALADGQPFERLPFVARPHAMRGAQALNLRRCHEPGMIVLVAGERQAEPFDGIGDEADRPIMRARLFEGLDQRRQVVAAEIGHQPRQFLVAAAFDQPGNRALIADVVEQALAPGRSALERQRGIELVRAAIDPLPEGLAAGFGEGGFEQPAVLEHDDVPAEIPEQRLEAFPQAFAHDGVEALPVVVDDPPRIAQAVLPAFQKRLEDVAFVHLGVADQRDHLPVGQMLGHALGVQVILDERGKQRLGNAEADGAGREVDVVHVLGARGVGLSAFVAAEILQAFPGSGCRTGTGSHGRSGSHAA